MAVRKNIQYSDTRPVRDRVGAEMASKQQIVSVLSEAEKEAEQGRLDTSLRLLIVSIRELLTLLEQGVDDEPRAH
ncbi:hypothetical protein [Vibrio sp. VPAP30]|uniref:hypothetical protein n=2 Tax=Vibrionaceae TaxID=641 RepID=UPI0012376B9C|nr:hypothetical protein [Vibrio sp. VPAP30]